MTQNRRSLATSVASVVLVCGLLARAAPAAGQPLAYVLGDRGPSDVVTVVDTATNAVVTRIAVGDASSSPTSSIAVGHDGSRAYVVNRPSGAVTVIDTSTHTVLGNLPVGPDPTTVVASPDGTRLYVGATPPGLNQAAIRVLGLPSGTLLGTIPLSAPFTMALAIAPDGRRLYATGWTGESSGYTIKVIDTAVGAVVASIPVVTFPYGIAVSPDGGRVFVSHGTVGTGTVTVISSATNSVLTTFAVGVNPFGIAFTPDGGRLYVPNSGVPFSISIVNALSNTVVGSIPGPDHMTDVAFTPDGLRAYVPHEFGVAIFNAVTNTAAGNLALTPAVDGYPRQIVMLPEPPQPPTDLFAAPIAGNLVTLHWRAAVAGSHPTGYLLEGGLAPGQVLASFPTGSALPTYTLSAPSGIFYVRLRAIAGGAFSDPSNEVRIVVNTPVPPSAPEDLVGLVNGSSLALAWRPSLAGGAATTHLLDVTGSLAASLTLGLVDAFSFAGVPPGTYTFAVRAGNAFGTSPPSNPVTMTFPGPCSGPPLVPAAFRAFSAGTRVSLFWEPGASGPAPQRFVLTVGGAFVGTLPLVGRSISARVGPGTYQLSLAAANDCGVSLATPVQTVTVP